MHARPFSKNLKHTLYFPAPCLPFKADGQAKCLTRPELPSCRAADVSWVAALLFLSPPVTMARGLSAPRVSAVLSQAVA